ncbi:MAG TPA: hypothetical protein VIH71_12920, partial [Solirubrobacteraceae bacterium]
GMGSAVAAEAIVERPERSQGTTPAEVAVPAPASAAAPAPAETSAPTVQTTSTAVTSTAVEETPSADSSQAAVVRNLESVSAVWPAVVELVRAEHSLLGAVICEAWPIAVDGDDLTLAFASSAQFLKKKAEDPNYRAAVSEALRSIAGGRWRLSYELSDELAGVDRPGSSEHSEEEWVARFMQEFNAEEVAEWGSGDGAQAGLDGASEHAGGVGPVISNEKGV